MIKHCLRIFTLALIVFLSSPLFAMNTNHYVIVIDAGSSGSRLHLFQLDSLDHPIPTINETFTESVKPGLSSFADQPEKAGDSLKKALDDAVTQLQLTLKQSELQQISVNVLATAGMRLLSADKQKAIYDHLTQYLQAHYPFRIGAITTISGQMEGLYGWLDVNYLLNNFQNHHATVGSIDMGGASTQIVFETTDKKYLEDEMTVRVANQFYHVFSKSFLGLGQDQARESIATDVAAANCYPIGLQQTSHFDLAACGAVYTHIIAKQKVAEHLATFLQQPFVAYSGIYYTYHFFNTDETPDQTTVQARIQAVCTLPWEQLQKKYPQVPEKYLSSYCANAAYQDELLYNTYQLHGNQLTVATQLNHKDIDWTLGAVLYALSQ